MPHAMSSEKRLEWKEKILKQEESGLSIIEWCHQNQVVEHCFYYWKKKLFPIALNRSSFIELADMKETGIFIKYREMRIYLDKHFDPITLKRYLLTLKETSC